MTEWAVSGSLAYGLALGISCGVPLGVLVLCIVKKGWSVKVFLVGAAAFFVSQIVLRIPLIQGILPQMSWYIMFSITQPVLYILFLGLTAGLFEETARWIGMKFLLKSNRSWLDAVLFGVGHGGVEALILVGLNLALSPVPATGSYEAFSTLMGGVERLSAMALHVGLSVMVMRGVVQQRKSLFWMAIVLHMVVDSGILILVQLLGASVVATEAVMLMIGALMIAYTLLMRKKWRVIS